jgi:4a-hydroxytetrahydrobiopterin dehydratase
MQIPEHWTHDDNMLKREIRCADFSTAFAFMTQVAMLAEQVDHHPNWSNIYNVVTIELTSHDAGNVVTEKDLLLARRINSILAPQS